jgi:hypothetical protein
MMTRKWKRISLLVLSLGCGVGRTALGPANDNRPDTAVARVPEAGSGAASDGLAVATDTGEASVLDAAADARTTPLDGVAANSIDAAADVGAGAPDMAGLDAVEAAGDAKPVVSDAGRPDVVDAATDGRPGSSDTGRPDTVDAATDRRPDAPDTGGADVVDAGADAGDSGVGRVDSGSDGPASGPWLVTVTLVGGGVGTVTSSPAGIQCGSTCQAAFASPLVKLSARTSNGSNSRFAGWGGACSGVTRDCTVALTASTAVTARFEPIDHNLVFLSSVDTYTSDLGSAVAYDGQCNQLATAAGINSATGDAYIAWVSDSQGSALSRLGTARGFMRMDGEPVADDPIAMIAQSQFYNPIDIDETGTAPLGGRTVLTGMDGNGNATQTACNDWTSKSGTTTGTAGCDSCGPPTWYYWENPSCSNLVGSVYCFMKTKTAALTITPQLGRKVFLSNGPVAMGQSADAKCESSKPSGTGTVVALRATTTTAASTMIDLTATYVRPDGIVVGLGADLIASTLKSGIWQQGNGQYVDDRAVWSGSSSPSELGTSASTCSDWTSNTGVVLTGASSGTDLGWWQDNVPWTCASTYTWSYCIEQ